MANGDEKLYTTLATAGSAVYEEKRSEFIGYAAHIKSEAEARDFISKIKAKHHDARHNVFAYTVGESIKRYSDDGEPQGTAGIPILEVINKSGISDSCVAVTRYFGGILLGAGGLVRAYTAAAKLAIEASGIVTYESYRELSITLPYSDYEKLSSRLPSFGAIIDNCDYHSEVTVDIAVKDTLFEDFNRLISELFYGRITVKARGTRYDAR